MTKMLIAFTINEREGKKYWNRVGAAFFNKDGSINVHLTSLPINGELQLREETKKEEDFG